MIGVEMLKQVTEMFPNSPIFADNLLRNGFAVATTEEDKKKLCQIFKEKGMFSSTNITDQTTRITLTGVLEGNMSYRFYCSSTSGKKTIIATSKVQPL